MLEALVASRMPVKCRPSLIMTLILNLIRGADGFAFFGAFGFEGGAFFLGIG